MRNFYYKEDIFLVDQYKCVNCGADMVFDIKTGTLMCHSCGHQDTIESMDDPNDGGNTSEAAFSEVKEDQTYNHYENNEAAEYEIGRAHG